MNKEMWVSFAMNPIQVKRREYMGLVGIAVGLLAGVAGIVCLLFLLPLGLSLIAFGTAALTSGILILVNIPDLVGPTEELW